MIIMHLSLIFVSCTGTDANNCTALCHILLEENQVDCIEESEDSVL